MNFLVSGGAGFIGSHLVARLLSDGHRVTVIDDFSTGVRQNLAGVLARIRLIEATITDLSACRAALDGVDVVLHQAALGSVPRSIIDPVTTHNVNAGGTLNLLIASKDARVKRFVYAASSSAYGDTMELPKHERMPPRARSPYAVAKLAGEQYCSAFFTTYGLETVTLRYFNVFGPRQDPSSQYAAVIPKFITAALRNESPTIYGDGEQTRDFTYVDNVVAANLRASFASSAVAGELFNVGVGSQTSLNELWRGIRSLTGASAEPIYAPQRAGDVRDSRASLERARSMLGFEPSVGFADGLRLTVQAFRQ